ncbi:MAG: sulfur carrier protein ThiS [Proteobacteria bacterium]|nr:sulfur carrier protein ThiS [Pseudomonadota bacterium]MBU1640809.1 sulfur carrier protein ThiS [Pseudomonadota bacterium]
MKIICNGKEQEVAAGCTLLHLLADLQLDPDTVVVECDKKIISRADYEGLVLTAGQDLELIRFVGGG